MSEDGGAARPYLRVGLASFEFLQGKRRGRKKKISDEVDWSNFILQRRLNYREAKLQAEASAVAPQRSVHVGDFTSSLCQKFPATRLGATSAALSEFIQKVSRV